MKEERCVKGATSTFRGHLIYWDGERWRYKDDDSIAGFENTIRPCKHCGRIFEGSNCGDPDPCLGLLPGVDNACCGHGDRESSYIRFTNGVVITGFIVEKTADDIKTEKE